MDPFLPLQHISPILSCIPLINPWTQPFPLSRVFHSQLKPVAPRKKAGAMAFLRKAGSMLGNTLSAHINQEITSSRPSIFQAIRCMATSKLYIGGLSYGTDEAMLAEAFGKYGEIAEARVIVDRDTGKSRGFGFVTYASVDDASAAIQALDQQELHGQRIRVDYANDRAPGYGGGGYRGGGYNTGGFGGGYNSNDGYGGNYGRGGGGYGGSGDLNPGVDK